MPQHATYAQHARHSKLLMSRILDIRKNASPFTLVLDDLNQPSRPLITEFIRRALSRKINVVFLSFEQIKAQHPAICLVPAWKIETGEQLLGVVENALLDHEESLVIIDSLSELAEKAINIQTLLNVVAIKHSSSIVGVYHSDLSPPPLTTNPYTASPLRLLKYTATTILTLHSFTQALASKHAKERSVAEPLYGLLNESEGIVQALSANASSGIVIEGEFRRRSGRPEYETFFLRRARKEDCGPSSSGMTIGTLRSEFVILLEEHPLYRQKEMQEDSADEKMSSTFNLDLTAKQREARSGVVLPYFDAQKEGGGEGGRILYNMGEEDDFDEEEDEI